jgi:uncharacterized protein (TIGR02231 family)
MQRTLRLAALALATHAALAAAQSAPPVSHVTLYPSGATVERALKIAAGTQKLEIDCLPGGFDEASLRVEGDAGVRVGDIATDKLEGVRAEACRRSPLDERIRQLEDQRAAIQTERDANELSISWLKQLGNATPTDGHGAAALPDARALAATSEALRRNAQEAYARRVKLARQLEDLDKALAPLRAERQRGGGQRTQWRAVRFVAQAARAASLRLVYEVPRAGWAPAYRASLDTTAGTVQLERQAQIAQATGEDWRGVHLTLSTGQPEREVSGPEPRTWAVDIAPPPRAVEQARSMAGLMPAPPQMMAPAPSAPEADRMDAAEPMFDVSVFEGSYATQFELPGGSDLASDGQRVTVSLSRDSLPVKLVARTLPHEDPRVFLVATAARPQGVWPRGTLQLSRDGVLVGSTPWNPAEGDELSLPFGADDLVRVSVEGQPRLSASAGLFGGRSERRMAVRYVVHNAHRVPVRLELLEAAPVSESDQIEVKKTFTPQPATERWHEIAGVAAWEQTLVPDQTARYAAEYVVSYPKDARVIGLER